MLENLTLGHFGDVSRQLANGSLCKIAYARLQSNGNDYTASSQQESSDVSAVNHPNSLGCVLKLPQVERLQEACNHITNERQMLQGLRHPSIINIFGYGLTPDDNPFTCLEYLPNGTLDQRLGTNVIGGPTFLYRWYSRTFSVSLLQVAFLKIAPIAGALRYLHDKCNIIHRDIKPSNIMYTADDDMKLVDFGLARKLPHDDDDGDVVEVEADESCSNKNDHIEKGGSGVGVGGFGDDRNCSRSFVRRSRKKKTEGFRMTGGTGSMRYMSPEVAQYEPYDESADVYSFAMVLWEYIALKRPFEYVLMAQWREYVVEKGCRPEIDESWPQLFVKLLQKMWSAKPTERPTMAQVESCLLELGQSN